MSWRSLTTSCGAGVASSAKPSTRAESSRTKPPSSSRRLSTSSFPETEILSLRWWTTPEESWGLVRTLTGFLQAASDKMRVLIPQYAGWTVRWTFYGEGTSRVFLVFHVEPGDAELPF